MSETTCPYCLRVGSGPVKDSRPSKLGNAVVIRRRRECDNRRCQRRWTTYEISELHLRLEIKRRMQHVLAKMRDLIMDQEAKV